MQTEKYVIKKEVVAVKETFLNLPKGKTIKFDCRDFAPYSTIQATVSRLNKEAGKIEFASTTTDNGATYEITRKN